MIKKEDTMLADFKDFFHIFKVDFRESKNNWIKIVKIIRNFFLFLTSLFLIPLMHLLFLVFPFLKKAPKLTMEERIDNFRSFMK